MPAPFRFDREFPFECGADALWSVLTTTDDYTDWWSWLRSLDVNGLKPGARARFEIRGSLPYSLRGTITVEELVAGERIQTAVEGDLHGPAQLTIRPAAQGCMARLQWSLELRDPVLRRIAIVGRPAMAWAHDRVVAEGVAQFKHRALM